MNKKQEFNLSENRWFCKPINNEPYYYFKEEDVKEFIRLLKIASKDWSGAEYGIIHDIIDKLAGKSLI